MKTFLNVVRLSTTILALVVITGCASSTKGAFKDIPKDQQSTLIIPNGFSVTNFSGKAVEWYRWFGLTITVPSGQNTVIFDCYVNSSNYLRNKRLDAYFEPGHTYILDYKGGVTYVVFYIYDNTAKKYVTPIPPGY